MLSKRKEQRYDAINNRFHFHPIICVYNSTAIHMCTIDKKGEGKKMWKRLKLCVAEIYRERKALITEVLQACDNDLARGRRFCVTFLLRYNTKNNSENWLWFLTHDYVFQITVKLSKLAWIFKLKFLQSLNSTKFLPIAFNRLLFHRQTLLTFTLEVTRSRNMHLIPREKEKRKKGHEWN